MKWNIQIPKDNMEKRCLVLTIGIEYLSYETVENSFVINVHDNEYSQNSWKNLKAYLDARNIEYNEFQERNLAS